MVSVQDSHVTGCREGSVGVAEDDKCRKGGWDQITEHIGAIFLPQPMVKGHVWKMVSVIRK